MARKKDDDNAKNYTMGQAIEDQAVINAAGSPQYRETGRQSYGDNEAKAEQMAKALRHQATGAKNGAVVEVENTGSKSKPDWTVIVSVPKRRGKK